MSLLETRGSLSNPRARMRAQGSDHRYHHNHENAKNAGLCEAGSSNQRITIDVNDDDDEVQVLTPRSVTQARNTRHNQREVASPTLDGGADLELRLGSSVLQGTYFAAASSQIATGWTHSTGVSRSTTIDLTSGGNDDDVVPLASGKRKAVQLPSERTKDIKLTCAICMDIMKEETSTVCGHIFCRSCILGAIQTQKKCPSCRRKLTNSSIHRIYLPGR